MSSNDQNVIIMNVKKHHVLPVRPAFRCNCTRQWHSQSVKSATVLINHQLPVSWFVLFSKWFTFQGTIVVSVYFRCFSHPSSADWNSVHWRRMWETAEIYGGNKWVSWEVNHLLNANVFFIAFLHTWSGVGVESLHCLWFRCKLLPRSHVFCKGHAPIQGW